MPPLSAPRLRSLPSLGLALLAGAWLGACEGDVSPGGGSPGTSTPNDFLVDMEMNGGDRPTDGSNTPGGSGGRMGSGGTIGVSPTPTDPPPDEPRPEPGELGPSPITADRYLDELSPEEERAFCEWLIAAQGGEGQRDCGDGQTVSVGTVEDCASGAGGRPHCQAGLIIGCFESIGGDICALFQAEVTPECSAYTECAAGG